MYMAECIFYAINSVLMVYVVLTFIWTSKTSPCCAS